MRILVLGAGGQVGRALQVHCSHLGELVALDQADADFTAAGAVARAVERVKPNLVVNAAAYTAVDKAESEPDLAQRINADAVGEVARACVACGASLIHYSTDYVFDGAKAEPYTVRDRPAPMSVYGKTKLAGERAIAEAFGAGAGGAADARPLGARPAGMRASAPHWLVLRIAWVYAPYGKNFLLTMLRVAREGKPLRVVADQHGTPMSADWIARMTAALVRATDADEGNRAESGPASLAATGVQHLSPAGSTTWHGFAQRIMERAHAMGLLAGLTPERAAPPVVTPIATSEYPTPARRPAQSRLDDSLGDLLPSRPDWSALLEETLTQLKAGER
jgi:dTDP-4-dehydrorhamnose reductase